ncbi:MAG: glycosyltransferase [Calditrichia bacterium]|nr:glycosyltransferase [Calditrichia bacterium]
MAVNNNRIVANPLHITEADIIVGIPSYNEADNIAFPTDVASRGLRENFSTKSSVIINVDNHSPDGTKEAFLDTPTEVPKIYISTAPGVKGKGNNFRNLFEAAVELNAKAIIVVDADLKSITPSWIRYLGEPLMGRFDYVAPIYARHKYDGSITNHIAYPLLRSLFGLRVRQPIGGDFGFSGKLARAFLSEKLWNDKIAHFGIDIWMTTIAIARRFNICQAFLGNPKIHNPKDPAADLGSMFTEVVSTLFDLIIDFEFIWKDTFESRPSNIYGFGLGIEEKPPVVNVNTDILYKSFMNGFKKYGEIWEKIIPGPEYMEISKLKQIKDKKQFYYSSDLWARVLFNFAIAYRTNLVDREKLIESMIPFYHSRNLSFINRTENSSIQDAEEYLENVTRVFEKEKYYLIQRWDASVKRLGHKLFK